MGISPNPIVSSGPPHVQFSSHARFRMEEHDVDRDFIEKLLTSPQADFRVDKKSGNYVFRSNDYRIIVKKGQDRSFFVMSVFKTDQEPD
jgi:hypothetical protein